MIRRPCGSTSGADCSPRRAPTAAPADTATTIWIAWQRISELVAQGINIAGIAQILHLEHRNSALESDNSDLKSENARLRSEEPTTQKEDGKPMTIYLDDNPLADDVPAADAAEQRQPADVSVEDAGLDPGTSPTCFSVTPTRPM